MGEASLVDRIRLGEDSTLALKRVRVAGMTVSDPVWSDLADELAAMANAAGGTAVLGVDAETRVVSGIPMDGLDVVEAWARKICFNFVEPPLDADIHRLTLEDALGQTVPILRIDLKRSLFMHRSPDGYFRRIGSSTRRISSHAFKRLMQQRSNTGLSQFDQAIVPGTSRSNLDYSLTQRFFSEEVSDESLRKRRLLVADEAGVERLTVAGVLLCTQNPQNWLRHAYMRAVSYAGERTDTRYQPDQRDIGGPLDQQIAEAVHFVRRSMRVRAARLTTRPRRPQFSERAVYEAIANAVAHRDYSMAGSRIRLHLFPNRLELYVPGSFAGSVTPDSLHLRQSNRNGLVVSLLARCSAPIGPDHSRLMSRRGEGVPKIRRECERLSGSLPEYSMLDDSELRLVIRAAGP